LPVTQSRCTAPPTSAFVGFAREEHEVAVVVGREVADGDDPFAVDGGLVGERVRVAHPQRA
jgi:hypothetical protein